MRYFSTTGIILRKQNSGENDFFVTIFSPEYGRLQAISRSSRKITSIKGPHLDPLNYGRFQLYKNGDRYLLTECKIENAFQLIKGNLDKCLYSLAACEILLKSIQDAQESPELFQLFLRTLEKLEKEDQHNLILEEFKIKLLKISGSWPDISKCYFCQNKWQTTNGDSRRAAHIAAQIWIDQIGNLNCLNCLPLSHNKLDNISFDAVKLAHFLAEYSTEQVTLKIRPEQLFALQKLTGIFLTNYLHCETRAEKILHS
jgi:DNA repair protein RecO